MGLNFSQRADYESWGRVLKPEHRVARPANRPEAVEAMAGDPPLLAYGCGRSYGDVALNPEGQLVDCGGLDRFMAFDRSTGVLTCEAGVTLAEILSVACGPDADDSGWFLPVSPGTRFVSVGGAIANDVHGKNHHAFGTFGEHVLSLELARSDGVVICSRAENAELFRATIGGLGLTGIILSATIQLRRVPGLALESEHIRFGSIQAFFELAQESAEVWEYTAAWIDCLAKGRLLGRGIFSRARHRGGVRTKPPPEPRLALPVEAPISLANRLTLPVFNAVYWRKSGVRPVARSVGGYRPVLYPLDVISGWNRLYGPLGFFQFHSVTPLDKPEVLVALLTAVSEAGQGSMLAVLKTFADRPAAGMLSFPMAGFTLTLDFPNHGESTRALLGRLEDIVVDAGGRLYPAKDGVMRAESFRRGYPQLEPFLRQVDPKMSSSFARRVGIVGNGEPL
jgi:FAD/FMN-containing dehydrogenase